MQVNWHNYKGEQVAEHKVRVGTSASVREVLGRLRDIEPEAKKAKALRLMEVLHSKVYKVRQDCSPSSIQSEQAWHAPPL